jgi:hypothetical protein
MSFKLKPTPTGTRERKPPVPIPVPSPKQVEAKARASGKDIQQTVHETQTPDGETAGAITTKTGEKVYQESVLWPPAKPPERMPMKNLKDGK